MSLTNGRDPYVTDSLGGLRCKQGKLAEAEKLLKQARLIEPGEQESGGHLAEVLHAQQRTKEALAVLDEVLKADPKNARAKELKSRLSPQKSIR